MDSVSVCDLKQKTAFPLLFAFSAQFARGKRESVERVIPADNKRRNFAVDEDVKEYERPVLSGAFALMAMAEHDQ